MSPRSSQLTITIFILSIAADGVFDTMRTEWEDAYATVYFTSAFMVLYDSKFMRNSLIEEGQSRVRWYHQGPCQDTRTSHSTLSFSLVVRKAVVATAASDAAHSSVRIFATHLDTHSAAVTELFACSRPTSESVILKLRQFLQGVATVRASSAIAIGLNIAVNRGVRTFSSIQKTFAVACFVAMSLVCVYVPRACSSSLACSLSKTTISFEQESSPRFTRKLNSVSGSSRYSLNSAIFDSVTKSVTFIRFIFQFQKTETVEPSSVFVPQIDIFGKTITSCIRCINNWPLKLRA